MTQIFISYSRNDMEFVQYLAMGLYRAGLDVWWDLSDIQGSDVWEKKIEEGLKTSQYFVVVMTPAALESRWVRREYLSADNKGLTIIPVRLKTYDELPLALRDIQPVDAVDRSYEDVLAEILKIVARLDIHTDKSDEGSTKLNVQLPRLGTFSQVTSAGQNFQEGSHASSFSTLEMGGRAIQIFFFVLMAVFAFGETSDEFAYPLGISAILTAFYFLYRRHFFSDRWVKIFMIFFSISHGIWLYSMSTDWGVDDFLGSVVGIAALVIAVSMIVKMNFERKPIPYFAVVFALFCLLFGVKVLLDAYGIYPSGISYPIVVTEIASAILLWVEI